MRVVEVLEIGARRGAQTRGVVAAYELRKVGVDLSIVQRLVLQGRVLRLWDGVFVFGIEGRAPVDGPPTRAHAALKHASQRHASGLPQPRPVVTGLVGARALGMRWVPDSDRVQVLVGPEAQHVSRPEVLVRRAHDLADIRTWNWAGVPLADPARLVIDGARECASLRDVRGLVLGSVADKWAAPAELTRLLDSGAVGGTAWARRAVRDAVRGAASPPEAELVDALMGCGWPFYANCEIRRGEVLIAVLDAYLLGTGVGAEVDSRERHEEAELLDATLDRHERVETHGLKLLHRTPTRFRRDPKAFVQALLTQVQLRAARGLGDPPGLTIVPRGPLLGVRGSRW